MKVLGSGIRGLTLACVFITSMPAAAVEISESGIGEVAISPLYTTRNDWETLINLTNVTDTQVIVKIRLHEGFNSRDVLDFNVALSSKDVFTARLFQGDYTIYGDNGQTLSTQSRPVLRVIDQANDEDRPTCTIPSDVAFNQRTLAGVKTPFELNEGTAAQTLGFDVSDLDASETDLDRLRDGYIEFIVMGTGDERIDWESDAVASLSAIGAAITNGDAINVAAAIEEHDCTALDLAFRDTTNPNTGERYIVETAQQLGEPTNSIKFNTRLLNTTLGVEVGVPVTTWSNFYNPASDERLGSIFPYVDGAVQPNNPAPLNNLSCNVTRGDERIQSRGQALGVDWNPIGITYFNGATGQNFTSCMNLVTAQRNFGFLEPSLADAFPPIGRSQLQELNFELLSSGLSSDLSDADVFALLPNAGDPFTDEADGANPNKNTSLTALLQSQFFHGVDAVSATIMREGILNEWSTNPSLGVSSDWIVTFPTKGHYVDGGMDEAGSSQEARAISTSVDGVVARRRSDVSPYLDYNTFDGDNDGIADYVPRFFPFEESWDGSESCDQYDFVIYDRAERSADDSAVLISPAPSDPLPSFCYETNVITFNGVSRLAPGGLPANYQDINTSALVDAKAGWMELHFDTAARTPLLPLQTKATSVLLGSNFSTDFGRLDIYGKPVIGFLLKVRNIDGGGIGNNYASAVEHGYRVDFERRNNGFTDADTLFPKNGSKSLNPFDNLAPFNGMVRYTTSTNVPGQNGNSVIVDSRTLVEPPAPTLPPIQDPNK